MPFYDNPDVAHGFIGRVNDAPAMHYENGDAIASFTLTSQAAAASATVAAGRLCRVVCLGKRAELAWRYLRAGQQVFVAGPHSRSQERGHPVSEIVASCLIPLGRLPRCACLRPLRACATHARAA